MMRGLSFSPEKGKIGTIYGKASQLYYYEIFFLSTDTAIGHIWPFPAGVHYIHSRFAGWKPTQ